MSAISAPAARLCRRSARGRPGSPAPTIFRPRPYARAPSSPTRCRPTLIAARAGPKSPMRSSGSSTRRRAGAEGELAVTTDNEMHDPVFPNGCAVCEVEVDPETGLVEIARYSVVDDVGRCINPLIVHGQTHGGVAQGVGEAMWEECVVDPDSGQ